MSVTINLLTGLMIIIAILIVLIILIQEDKSGGGMGILGGSSSSFLGASSGNILTKITTVLVMLFFVLSIVIGSLSAESTKKAMISETEIFKQKYGNDNSSAQLQNVIDSAPNTILVQDFENLLLNKLDTEELKAEVLQYYEKNKNEIHYNLTKEGIKNKNRIIELLNLVDFSLEVTPTIINN